VGSRSPAVWAHWLINFLPTAYLASKLPSEYDDFPVLVPTNIPSDAHWIESLNVVLNGRSTVPFRPEIDYTIEDLVCFDPAPVYDLPFPGDPSRRSGIWFYPEVMMDFQQTLLTWSRAQGAPRQGKHRRIFVARKGQKRRFNQDEAIAVAREFGFEPVYAEDLTLAEKIRLFHEAEIVIGPGGSGMANVLFCQPGATVFYWWPLPLKPSDNFDANLALVAGANLEIAAPEALSHTENGYEIHLDYLHATIKRLASERKTRR
jgi:hypothetical protein